MLGVFIQGLYIYSVIIASLAYAALMHPIVWITGLLMARYDGRRRWFIAGLGALCEILLLAYMSPSEYEWVAAALLFGIPAALLDSFIIMAVAVALRDPIKRIGARLHLLRDR